MPAEVPSDWIVRPLGRMATRIRRRLAADPEHILMISSTKGWIPQSEKYGRFMAGESLKNYVELHTGEFAYNKGNSKTYPYGCVFRLEEWNRAAVPNVYISFALDDRQIDHGYASHFFAAGGLNPQLQRLITSTARSNGLLNIAVDDFFACEVPLPPAAEQRKIAAILSTVDDAIVATRKVMEQTKRVKHGLLQALMTRGIGHTRFKKTDIGEIPETWGVEALEDLAVFSSGHGFRPQDWSDEGLPIIRIQNLNGSKEFNYYCGETKEQWVVSPGTLLFAWAGSAGASFGPTFWRGETGVLNQHIYRVEPAEYVNILWLYQALKLVTKQIERRAHGFKATLLHVRKADITGQRIPVPPPEEQAAIADLVDSHRRRTEVQHEHLRRLERLKRGLLQDLLTGRVRVQPD